MGWENTAKRRRIKERAKEEQRGKQDEERE